jgi:hypothetical protein
VSTADPARAALDARAVAWMREPAAAPDAARFGALALDLFAFQFAHCAPYRRFCEGRGTTPARVRDWTGIPPVPAGAFKELPLCCFPPERALKVFRTSGTATLARGALHLDTLEVYEASLLPSFRRHLLPDLAEGARARILVLAPPPDELPDSSLSHMFGVAVRELGDAGSGFLVKGGELDAATALAALADLERGGGGVAPLLVCGAAFAFVHLLDALAERGVSLRLPGSARVMETGGFKGRARERSQGELYAEIGARLGIPPARIANQYGMTELGSQFYDSVLSEPGAPRRKLSPPWARVRIVDPVTGAASRPGEVGAIVVFDLANTGSVLAIQTADLGRESAGGFEVIGREEGAEARGCSIAADELLGGATG